MDFEGDSDSGSKLVITRKEERPYTELSVVGSSVYLFWYCSASRPKHFSAGK